MMISCEGMQQTRHNSHRKWTFRLYYPKSGGSGCCQQRSHTPEKRAIKTCNPLWANSSVKINVFAHHGAWLRNERSTAAFGLLQGPGFQCNNCLQECRLDRRGFSYLVLSNGNLLQPRHLL